MKKRDLEYLVNVEKKPIAGLIGNGLKKIGNVIFRTFAQSPDADILLTIGLIVDYLGGPKTHMEAFLPYGFAIKQYIWGHAAYFIVDHKIKKRKRGRSVKALKKTYTTISDGPCFYCGARYRIKEFEKSLNSNKIKRYN